MSFFTRNRNRSDIKNLPTFQLGDRVRDKVTKFEGVISSCTLHITMCDVYTITPTRTDTDGKPLDAKAYDEVRLELINPKWVNIGTYAHEYRGIRDKVGWEVKDKVDGLAGTITAIAMDAGESVALVQPPVIEGKEPKSYWRTIQSLDFVKDRRKEVGVPEVKQEEPAPATSSQPTRTGAGEVPDREPIAPPNR